MNTCYTRPLALVGVTAMIVAPSCFMHGVWCLYNVCTCFVTCAFHSTTNFSVTVQKHGNDVPVCYNLITTCVQGCNKVVVHLAYNVCTSNTCLYTTPLLHVHVQWRVPFWNYNSLKHMYTVQCAYTMYS